MSDEIEKTMLDTLEKEANIGKIKADLEEAKANRAYNGYKKRQKQEQDLQEAMDDNIVKRVCKELGITQRELAEIIKVNAGTPAQWVSKGEVPPTYQYLLELMLENKHLKEKIAKLTAFKELLNEI